MSCLQRTKCRQKCVYMQAQGTGSKLPHFGCGRVSHASTEKDSARCVQFECTVCFALCTHLTLQNGEMQAYCGSVKEVEGQYVHRQR